MVLGGRDAHGRLTPFPAPRESCSHPCPCAEGQAGPGPPLSTHWAPPAPEPPHTGLTGRPPAGQWPSRSHGGLARLLPPGSPHCRSQVSARRPETAPSDLATPRNVIPALRSHAVPGLWDLVGECLFRREGSGHGQLLAPGLLPRGRGTGLGLSQPPPPLVGSVQGSVVSPFHRGREGPREAKQVTRCHTAR